MKANTRAAKKHEASEADGTQERILRAAEELFIESGFDGVSINDVAVHANVAKGLVFYYFDNKQNLFDLVLDGYYTAQAAALMPALSSKGTVRERIHAGIDAYLDFVETHPGYPRLIQREICSGPRNLEKVMQYMAPMQRWGETIFQGLFPPGGPLSPRHFFITVFGMAINYYTYSPVLERLWDDDPMSAPALAERREHLHSVIDALIDKYALERKE